MFTKYKDLINNNKPFFVKDYLIKPISWKELETLINLRPFVCSNRLTIISNKQYQWNDNNYWTSNPNTYPPEIIEKELHDYVMYIADASRATKTINLIAYNLEKITDTPVDAHIYFSKNINTKGFGKHKDSNSNIIVGSEGKSIVKVWDLDNKLIINEELESKDMVFIPASYYHEFIPLTKRLSVSFPYQQFNKDPKQSRHWVEF
jgi:hypothetical protein